MWIAVALGSKLSQPLAVMLDRVFVDIAVRDAGIAFQRFSSLREPVRVALYFRPAPLCFAPVSYSPGALCDAADQAAGFAYLVGKLLEDRLGVGRVARYAGIAPVESGDHDLVARIDQLTAQTEELMRSGDWANAVLGHRMLLRAQALCALLAYSR